MRRHEFVDLLGDLGALGALGAQRRELAASRGSTTAAALVPVTTTVWAANAAKISSVSRAPMRGAR